MRFGQLLCSSALEGLFLVLSLVVIVMCCVAMFFFFFQVLLPLFGLVAVDVGGDSGAGSADVVVVGGGGGGGGGLGVSERRGTDTSTQDNGSDARTS